MSIELPPGSHIHFTAICGVGMGSLAALLHAEGYRISGSDENVYPPMSTFLEAQGIAIKRGYRAEHLVERPDLVVIGNAVSRENPEAQEVSRAGIPFVSLPQALGEFLVDSKHSVVVAGTHGKTTTTSVMAWVLTQSGLDPSFFVGGIPLNFRSGFQRGSGSWVVMEGDEYDSAFFDKGPKFLHYRPERVILTSVEFDHADIYRDLAHVKESFGRLIDIIPSDGGLLVCSEYSEALDLARSAGCPVTTYGLSGSAEWQAKDITMHNGRSFFSAHHSGHREGPIEIPLIGRHNVTNALAVYVMAREIGLGHASIARAMASFKGVKRRQELKGEVSGATVLDDFAHHPTAVRDTIAAVREAYPDHRLWAIFEPRSQTSRRRIFLSEFATSLAAADRVIVANLYEAGKIPSQQRLSPEELIGRINRQKGAASAIYLPTVEEITVAVVREARPGDVILVMSNGGFGGLPDKIVSGLEARGH
jgi:UDP-N-acetylmuramate: L-alanyl-gamma-D-glutamyl-meso-diaminopimelate ligase